LSHNINEILDALTAQVHEEIPEFGLVSYEHFHSSQISAGQYPVCLFMVGVQKSDYEITSTETITMNILVSIIGDDDQTDADMYAFSDRFIDAINTDITLNGTCLRCLNLDADPPSLWPKEGKKFVDRRLIVEYRRDR
jgi:hypothetical protein